MAGFIDSIKKFSSETFNWKNVYSVGKVMFWPFILVAVLQTLASVLGIILFVIPGFIISVYLSFAIYAVVRDNKRGIDSLVYSFHLVRYRWFAVFVRMVVLGVIVLVTGWLIILIVSMLAVFAPGFIGDIFVVISGSIIQVMILTPFVLIYGNKLYDALKKDLPALSVEKQALYRKNLKILIIVGLVVILGTMALLVIGGLLAV